MRWCLNINVLHVKASNSLGSSIVAKNPLLSLSTGWLKVNKQSTTTATPTKKASLRSSSTNNVKKRTCPGKRGRLVTLYKWSNMHPTLTVSPCDTHPQNLTPSWQLCHVYTIGYVARPRNKLYIKLVDICHTQMKNLPWQTIRWRQLEDLNSWTVFLIRGESILSILNTKLLHSKVFCYKLR